MGSSVSIDFDHFQVFLAFLQILDDLNIIFMLMSLLKVLQHFIKNRLSHFILSFFSFFKEIVIFVLQFFMLKALAVQIDLFFIAEMRRGFLIYLLFNVFGYTEAVRINFVVVFSIIVYLRFEKHTLFMFYI